MLRLAWNGLSGAVVSSASLLKSRDKRRRADPTIVDKVCWLSVGCRIERSARMVVKADSRRLSLRKPRRRSSFLIGPPKVKPGWLRLKGILLLRGGESVARVESLVAEIVIDVQTGWYALLETMLMIPALARPNSALYPLLLIWNSLTSWLIVGRTLLLVDHYCQRRQSGRCSRARSGR